MAATVPASAAAPAAARGAQPSPELAQQLSVWAAELQEIEAEQADAERRSHSRRASRRASGEGLFGATGVLSANAFPSAPPSSAAGPVSSFGPGAPPPTAQSNHRSGGGGAGRLQQADLTLALASVAAQQQRDGWAPSSGRVPSARGAPRSSDNGTGRSSHPSSGDSSPSHTPRTSARVYREQEDRLVLEGSDEDDTLEAAGGVSASLESGGSERRRVRRPPKEHGSPVKDRSSVSRDGPPLGGSQLIFSDVEVGSGDMSTAHLPSLGGMQRKHYSMQAPPPTAQGRVSRLSGSVPSAVANPPNSLQSLPIEGGGQLLVRDGLLSNPRRRQSGGPTMGLPLAPRPASLAPFPASATAGDRSPNSGGIGSHHGYSGSSGGGEFSAGGGSARMLSQPSSGSSTPQLRAAGSSAISNIRHASNSSRRQSSHQFLTPLTATASSAAGSGSSSPLAPAEASEHAALAAAFGAGVMLDHTGAAAPRSRGHSPLSGSRRMSAEPGALAVWNATGGAAAIRAGAAAQIASAMSSVAPQSHSLSSLAAARAQRRRSVELAPLGAVSDVDARVAAASAATAALHRAHPALAAHAGGYAPADASSAAHALSSNSGGSSQPHSRPTTPYSNAAAFESVSRRRSLPPLGLANIGEKLNERATHADG